MRRRKYQRVCKPGSVHLLRGCAAIPLGDGSLRPSSNQPGRRAGTGPCAAPIRFCSRWGLPCRSRCRARGALLPHPFNFTLPKTWAEASAIYFLLHFPWGYPRRALPGTVVPWSPDFPRPGDKPQAAAARPSGGRYLARPRSRSKRRERRIERHSPSISPSTSSGRKRRWNAVTAAFASLTS